MALWLLGLAIKSAGVASGILGVGSMAKGAVRVADRIALSYVPEEDRDYVQKKANIFEHELRWSNKMAAQLGVLDLLEEVDEDNSHTVVLFMDEEMGECVRLVDNMNTNRKQLKAVEKRTPLSEADRNYIREAKTYQAEMTERLRALVKRGAVRFEKKNEEWAK